jgi:hypothetical protein
MRIWSESCANGYGAFDEEFLEPLKKAGVSYDPKHALE